MTAAGGAPVAPTSLAEHVARVAGPHADDLGPIIGRIAECGVTIAAELARAALAGRLGTTGETNVQGEAVKKLDVWSNEVVVRALTESGRVATLVSEEMEAPVRVHGAAPWVVCFDPVDGSSNLDVNGVVGTIFSIRMGWEIPAHTPPPSAGSSSDVTTRALRPSAGRGSEIPAGTAPPSVDRSSDPALQPGTAQVAAGYVMYGPSTVMVLATAHGVEAFTLDASSKTFLLTQAKIRIPSRGRIYSVNEGNAAKWEPGMRRYIEHLRAADAATDRPYSARYVGSLVADFHRTLLEGGIYLYPGEAGRSDGKLRLQYEAAPMAMVVEQAGGRASTGRQRIMTITPATHHQRVPLLVGSPEDVALAEEFVSGRRS